MVLDLGSNLPHCIFLVQRCLGFESDKLLSQLASVTDSVYIFLSLFLVISRIKAKNGRNQRNIAIVSKVFTWLQA